MMILDGVCYPVVQFCRVILYVWRSPFVVSLSLTGTSIDYRVLSVADVYLGWYFRRLCLPRCYAINDTFFT